VTTSGVSSEARPGLELSWRHAEAWIEEDAALAAGRARAAVVLCDIEGLSYEEIAATLGVKLGTVRSRIHRGRAQLRAALEHRAPRRLAEPGSAPEVTP
jgi:RNA polymerase sigma-70 factor (ECF subfamily)